MRFTGRIVVFSDLGSIHCVCFVFVGFRFHVELGEENLLSVSVLRT